MTSNFLLRSLSGEKVQNESEGKTSLRRKSTFKDVRIQENTSYSMAWLGVSAKRSTVGVVYRGICFTWAPIAGSSGYVLLDGVLGKL